MEDLPEGTPLETPLHPKKKRRSWLQSDGDEVQKNRSEDVVVVSADSEENSSEECTPEELSFAMNGDIVKTEPFEDPLSETRGVKIVNDQSVDNVAVTADRDNPLEELQSTATFVECGSPRLTRRLHQSSREDKMDGVLNFGSEEEEDSDDDEDETSQVVPRGLRMFVQVDEDTPQEVQAAIIPLNTEVAELYEPLSLFDFHWRKFPTPPIAPELRREVFVGRYGPTTEPTSNPYETFVKIWDRPVMEEIARQTNIYAQQYAKHLIQLGEMKPTSRIVDWRDTDADELYIYFALVMAMGITIKSRLETYWTTDNNIFSTPGFSVYMPIRRFQILSRCLHFTDNDSCSPYLTRSQAKICKIQPIVDHLNNKFQALYSLGQNIALDESLTQWKGWLDIKQYIPNKVAVGIKTYEVCDSRSGYLWKFEVHSGGESETPENIISGNIPNLVLRLLQGLENRGHTVWMDNFYNSPALARILKTQGFDCVGTLRTNRQFVPKQIVSLHKSDMRAGQVCGYTSGDVDVMVWRDRNTVAMISTYHGIAVSESKPVLVKDYNVCMGGVDKKDQLISMYPIERKRTQVWYKKFFRRLLNTSILNAYVIYKHNTQKTSHRAFRMELVLGILERHQQKQEISLTTVRGVPKFSAVVQAHFPLELSLYRGDKSYKKRRLCVLCKKRTHIMCNACNVSLCFSMKPEPSCYMLYHT